MKNSAQRPSKASFTSSSSKSLGSGSGIGVSRRFRIPKGYDGTAVTSRTLCHLLPEVLTSIRVCHQDRPDLIIASWKEIVGPAIAPLTQALSFSDGVLKVTVKNSTLHSLLRQNEKSRLLAALKQKFPDVVLRDIEFRIG